MEGHRVFISHSSKDKEFAKSIVAALKSPEMKPWIDHEQIFSGDDIFDKIGEGLTSMDIMIFLASSDSLASEWVALEVKYAVLREIEEKRMLLLPFRIHGIQMTDLPWFLRVRNAPSITTDASGTSLIVDRVRSSLEDRFRPSGLTLPEGLKFKKDERIEKVLSHIGLADWVASQEAAIVMSKMRDTFNNEIFDALVSYLESPDENQRWAAVQVIECSAQIAPELFDFKLLNLLGNHKDFSIRTIAALVCYDFAHFAPNLVPVNLIIKLSSFKEDWYVNSPAIGALKTLVRWRPTILRIFFMRLRSKEPYSRELSAEAICDISRKEPEVIDPKDLERAITHLKEIGDKNCVNFLQEAQSNVKPTSFGRHYRYGAF
ncbi:MAG: toll/interleukin-1 receptor domain-containing protein [Candidatus Bathyarchaeia archaeon]|jgi:hypothetical protein